MNSEERKEYMKAWYEANKDKCKAWYQANKEHKKEQIKAWREAHKKQYNTYRNAYTKSDLNSLGQTKQSIRRKSRYYLKKYGTKIEGYQIHHCCTYDDPYKFIYCSKEMHRLIHAYLRQHEIDADSNHYEQIKHLLDDSVVLYNIQFTFIKVYIRPNRPNRPNFSVLSIKKDSRKS